MAEGGNLRAGIYERVSVKLTGKEARSVAQQNARNLAACKDNGWAVAGRYADPGVSASRYARNKRREEYERMRADVSTGLLDVIVVWKANRIDRKLGEWSALLEECRDRGVKIYITYGEGHLYDPRNGSDWRQLATDGVAAAADSDQISADVKRAMQENLREGRPHGPVPFGYRREYDEYRNITAQVPDPQTGPVRREIVTRVAAGEALTAISLDLAERKVPVPRGGRWSTSSIRSLVLSPANIAQRRYDPEHAGAGERTRGAAWWQPLVDEGTWLAATARLEAARRTDPRPGAPEHHWLLSYLAACGVCGSPLGVYRDSPQSVHAYRCWRRGCTSMRHDWLDAYVTGALCTLLDTPAFWDELLHAGDPPVRQARQEAERLRARLAEARKRAAAGRISLDALEQLEAAWVPRLREAERAAEPPSVPARLLELHRRKDGGGILAVIESWTVAARKALLRDVFDGIVLLRAPRPGRVREFDPYRVLIVQNGKAR